MEIKLVFQNNLLKLFSFIFWLNSVFGFYVLQLHFSRDVLLLSFSCRYSFVVNKI